MNLWKAAGMTTFSSRRAMTRQATLRLRQVRIYWPAREHGLLNKLADDVRDLYRRAEQEELIVEGLREGENLVGQE